MLREDVESQPTIQLSEKAQEQIRADIPPDENDAESAQKSDEPRQFKSSHRLFCTNKRNKSLMKRSEVSGNSVKRPPEKSETVQDIWVFFKSSHFERERPMLKDGYTTHSFNRLPRPLPVDDVFFIPRTLTVLRLLFLLAWNLICVTIIYYSWLYLLLAIAAAIAAQWFGIHGISIGDMLFLGFPTVKQVWSPQRYPQRIWVRQDSMLVHVR